MEILIKAAQLFLSLSILVVLHEFGHYIPARLFKTRVEKFYLFFNPWFCLFKKKIGDTEWGIGWLPLGGFVKIAGMIDESMDKEQMALPPQPWEFRSKPAWQRLIIMIGGVVVNVIAAVIIYVCVVFTYGEEQLNPSDLKAGMSINPYLEKYGMVSGDNVIEIEGKKVEHVLSVNNEIMLRGKRKITVLHADGKKESITLPENIDFELFENGAFPAFGLRTTNLVIDTVLPKKPAFKAKLMKGDVLCSINNRKIVYYDDLKSELFRNLQKEVIISVLRGSDTVKLNLAVPKEGIVGLNVSADSKDFVDYAKIKEVKFSFGESIGRGISRGYYTLNDYASQLKFLFTSKGATEIGGFASIGKMFPSEWNWEIFWLNTAFISIALAFMNILPIPALDGGHVVFLLYEIVTGKEAPQKVLEYAQYVGIFLLLGLTLYANGNDLFKAIFG
jgi:regulator of sigma E protease